MRTILTLLSLLFLIPQPARARQITAGSPEDKMFQMITAETDPEAKLQLVIDFEKQFPQSRALTSIYSIAIDIYREKGDQEHVIEYAEKALKLDQNNVTALMVLSRNYAIQAKEIDRAIELAERAVEVISRMKNQPRPTSYTESRWQEYLQTTEAAAQSILEYTKMVKAHEQAVAAPDTSADADGKPKNEAPDNR